MAIPAQFAETGLTGSLTSSIDNSTATPTFTATMVDADVPNTSRIPSSQTQLFEIGRGTATVELFYCTTSTTNGITTFTTIARGLPRNYSTTPLTAVAANYQPHFTGDEISVVDTSTYVNILALIVNGTVPVGHPLSVNTVAFAYSGAGVLNAPTFTNAAARDAAITSPADGDIVKLDSPVATQVYDSGTATWTTIGTVTSVPNASITVQGLSQEATQAAIDNGTVAGSTGADNFVTPAQINPNYLTNAKTTPVSGDLLTLADSAASNAIKKITYGNLTKAFVPNAGFTAKGDLLVGTGAGTDSTLTVGTNGYAIVADSTQTTGLKYQNGGLGSYSSGQTTRAYNAGTGTQTIAHGLGVIPKRIRIYASRNGQTSSSSNPTYLGTSIGSATPTGGHCQYYSYAWNSSSNYAMGSGTQDASNIINTYFTVPVGTGQTVATVSAVDATNITLNFSVHSSLTTNACLIDWEAEA